jgi:hypothetical protein
MEGTQASVLRADALKLDRVADKLDQVNARLDVFCDGAHLTTVPSNGIPVDCARQEAREKC